MTGKYVCNLRKRPGDEPSVQIEGKREGLPQMQMVQSEVYPDTAQGDLFNAIYFLLLRDGKRYKLFFKGQRFKELAEKRADAFSEQQVDGVDSTEPASELLQEADDILLRFKAQLVAAVEAKASRLKPSV